MSHLNVALDLTEAESVALQAMPLPAAAEALTIATHGDYEEAGAFLVEIRRRRVAIAEAFRPSITAAHTAHKNVLALCQRADAPAAKAEHAVKGKMAMYAEEREQLRRIAEEQARREREQQEVAQRTEQARQQREADAMAEAARMADAERAMDAGDLDRAQQILDMPATPALVAPYEPIIPAAVDAPAVPKAAGVSIRRSWTFRVVDPAKVARAYCCPDEKRIAALVRALGPEAAVTVGGIEIVAIAGVAARVR